MKIINQYHIEIRKDEKHEYKLNSYKVLLENDNYMVIDTFNFQTLNKTKRDSEIDKPIIFEMNFGHKDMDYICYIFWTYGKRKPETIKKDITKWIEKKYGYLQNINLDFIK